MKLIPQNLIRMIKKFFPFFLFPLFLYFSSFFSAKTEAAGQDCCDPGWDYEPPAAQCQNSSLALKNTNCIQGAEECIFRNEDSKWICQILPTPIPLPTPLPTSPLLSQTVNDASAINFNRLREAFPTGSLLSLFDLSLGLIISKALIYVFAIAGLLLLFMFIAGGFQMMFGAADPKGQEAASKKVTNALIGFLIIFASYWVVQIVEVIFGISILK